MLVYRTDFYQDFVCSGSACKEHCCGGWRVLLDADALHRFRAEKGMTGLKLRLAMKGADTSVRGLFGIGLDGDGEVTFNKHNGTCLFYNREGLCALQLKKGHDFLPLTCRVFPRERRLYGPFAEEHLDLSCMEAARLFLERTSGKLQAYDEEVSYGRYGNNENEAYLYGLFDAREKLIGRLEAAKDRDDLETALRDIVAQCEVWQERCVSGDENPFADEEKADVLKWTDTVDTNHTNHTKTEQDTVRRYLPMPIGQISITLCPI